ncbi:alpha/beta hydrolase [Streptacidiphilus anmyonensis]|uniref:alpha/beta hydrolase n=1 Tax=Streptacidiphilus anmyonensis TaxID=405782 RepID=UPI0007C7EF03|nr:alpha/beta hydrolase-fold protein [Streptacidiphilus anmyonensis]
MSLTGTAFFYTLIAATIVAVVVTMVTWGAVRGPKYLRGFVRLSLIGLCQLTAIAVVAVWINNANGLYSSWGDLFGQQDNAGVGVTGDAANPQAQAASFTGGPNGFQRTVLHGAASGLTGEVLVWTPPQYSDPQYRNYSFPVVELLHGYPGSPETWLKGGGMPGPLTYLMAQGKMKPAILVVPRINPNGVNTDCTDVGNVRNGTWLDTDVPNLIKKDFRVLGDSHAWGLVGDSTGGYCATKLVLQHPDRFGAAVALSPDDFHGDPTVVRDKAVLATQNPLALMKAAGPQADVSILIATTAHDRWSTPANAQALRAAAKFPVTVAQPIVLKDGGHNWGTWASLFPVVFPWLSQQLDAPQLVQPAAPTPAPAPKGALPPGQVGAKPSASPKASGKPAGKPSVPPAPGLALNGTVTTPTQTHS